MPFRTIAGHRRVLSLLSRAVARQTLPQSLLLSGPAGIGKRAMALAVAEALNCLQPAAPADALDVDACGTCASCRRIGRGVHPDVILLEPGESGSIKIEQVRDVVDRAAYRPFEGLRRVVIIDEADALVTPAQHALLKTLEEPPPASVFALVSSLPDALLPTVRSRCTQLRCGPLTAGEVAAVLIRDHGYAEADARAAASDADGRVGAALAVGAADLVAARRTAQRLLEHTARVSDPVRRLETARELTPGKKTSPAVERAQVAACCRALASLLRDVSILSARADPASLSSTDLKPDLERLTGAFDIERSVRAFSAVDRALGALERNANPKVVADWLALHL